MLNFKSFNVNESKLTKDDIIEIANRYNTKEDFYKNNSTAYTTASRNGWLQDVTKHMKSKRIIWTLQMLIDVANKYDDLDEFRKKEPKAVHMALKRHVYDDITSHMDSIKKRKLAKVKEEIQLKKILNPVYTKDHLTDLANKYSTKLEFKKDHPIKYAYAVKKNWISDITPHMKNLYTKDYIRDISLKYRNREDFKKGRHKKLYSYAYRMGWLDDIMPISIKSRVRPNVTQLFRDGVSVYKTVEDLKSAEPVLYDIAFKMGWIDKLYGDNPAWKEKQI